MQPGSSQNGPRRRYGQPIHSLIKRRSADDQPVKCWGIHGVNSVGFSGHTYSLNLGLQLPIFTGFTNEYRAREASDELLAASARADQMRQAIMLQVLTAYSGLQTATRRVRTAVDLLASAQQSEQVALGRYREGVGSIVDLLIAQSALADARAQSIQTRWQWRQALAQLAHDVGTLGIHGEPMNSDQSQPGQIES